MVTNYRDPGTYIAEIFRPRAALTPSLGFNVVIIGEGKKTKSIVNEKVIRGQVYAEILTVAGVSPHTATLAHTSDQNQDTAVIYRNGTALPDESWQYTGATTIQVADGYYQAGAIYTLDYIAIDTYVDHLDNSIITLSRVGLFANSTNYKQGRDFTISGADGLDWSYSVEASFIGLLEEIFVLTVATTRKFKISLNGKPSITATVVGAVPATTSATEAAADINDALTKAVYLNYDTMTTGFTVGDTVTGFTSGASGVVENNDNRGTIGTLTLRSYAAGMGGAFQTGETITGALSGSAKASGPKTDVYGTNYQYTAQVYVAFKTQASPFVIGETITGVTSLATGIVTHIYDAGLTGYILMRGVVGSFQKNENLNSGIVLRAVADGAAIAGQPVGKVALVSPSTEPYTGDNSNIVLTAVTGYTGLSTIFGINEDASPYEYRGVGRKPAFSQVYYVTYEIKRPDADYDWVKEYLTDDDFYNDIGGVNASNPLSLAGSLAWSESILKLYVIQVKDGDDDGIYTDADYFRAIDVLTDNRELTEVVCLRSNAAIRAKLYQMMEQECSLTKSNLKRCYIGAPRDTQPGNGTTPDTFIYMAKRELRPTGSDVARGRFILNAPANWTYSFVDEFGTTQDMAVDSSFFSVCVAARVSSFEKASDTLFHKRFSQMTIDNPYSDSVRRELSANGINVLVAEGGSAVIVDSLTTDGSGDARYEEPSSSVQKDLLAFDIAANINSQLLGIVPDDPADMVANIKTVVGGVILGRIDTGDIGYYTNSDGTTVRDIDYTQDITAYRDTLDARTYRFKYFFNLKYPAKRFYGEFTVDVPFTIGT